MRASRAVLSPRGIALGLLAGLLILSGCQISPAPLETPSINLRSQAEDPEIQDALLVGSVIREKEITEDLAVCHVQVKPAEKEGATVTQTKPVLVAYIRAGDEKTLRVYTPKQACAGTACKTIDIYVDDHDTRFITAEKGLECSDPHGILKRSGHEDQTMLAIAELALSKEVDLSLVARNAFDGGIAAFDFFAGDTVQRCEIPPDHQHARYGQGWYTDPSRVTPFGSDNDLYVCSGGVLVCIVSSSFMVDPDNQVVIVGNDLNNTIMPSGLIYTDSERYCRRVESSPEPDDEIAQESRRYKVDGWKEEWRAGFRLFGEAGHDWIIGGPNAASIYGGAGNDLLVGGESGNYLFGERGLDVMHGGHTGLCDGGPPEVDHDCVAGDPTVRWWPYEGTVNGDCCCHSCPNNDGCVYSDITPGVSTPDVPPVPW